MAESCLIKQVQVSRHFEVREEAEKVIKSIMAENNLGKPRNEITLMKFRSL
eukprot:Awhi_evm1s2028